MNQLPLVTVLVPTLNEAADIAHCIDAIADQDYPLDRLEVVVVDGCSEDGTIQGAERALKGHPFGCTSVISNPSATTPSNLNLGLARCSGDFVCRVDARSRIPQDYVRTCTAILLERPEIGVVGGRQLALARDRTALAVGIARALNNRFAMGGARYRTGAESGVTDTVYLGAFWTRDLRRVGGWDERMSTNQDYELNRRIGRESVVWFDARLEVGYLPRASIPALWRQYRRFGRWKMRYWRLTEDRPRPRQLALLLGAPVAGLLILPLAVRAARGRSQARLLAASLIGVAAALEDRGSRGPDGGPLERSIAIAAMVTVATGWWSGVVGESLRQAPRRGPCA